PVAALQPVLFAKSSFRYDMRTRRQGPLLLQLTRLSPAYCYQSLLDQTDETPVASMAFVGKPRCSIRRKADRDKQIDYWGRDLWLSKRRNLPNLARDWNSCRFRAGIGISSFLRSLASCSTRPISPCSARPCRRSPRNLGLVRRSPACWRLPG